MNLNIYLNNIGLVILSDFKDNKVFKEDTQIPMDIIDKPYYIGDKLQSLILKHNEYLKLLLEIKTSWVGFINQNLLAKINLYERELNKKLETESREINKLFSECSFQKKGEDNSSNKLCIRYSHLHKSISKKRGKLSFNPTNSFNT